MSLILLILIAFLFCAFAVDCPYPFFLYENCNLTTTLAVVITKTNQRSVADAVLGRMH